MTGPRRLPAAPTGSRDEGGRTPGSAPRTRVILIAGALVVVALAATPSCAVAADPVCRAMPQRAVTVFFDGERDMQPLAEIGSVTIAGPPSGATYPRTPLRGGDGRLHKLAYDDPTGPLPVREGAAYDLRVEFVPGEPSPCALLLSDAEGLLLAAASDLDLGERVMKSGVPGFTLRLQPTECPSRPPGTCYQSRVNAVLEVTHEGRTIRLHQGESGRLGRYRVTCLIAERVAYKRGCADAGVFQVSYTIRRQEG